MDKNLRLRVILDALDKATGPLKSIESQSGKTGKALRATRDRLKALEGAQRDIARRRELEQSLVTTTLKLTEQRRTVDQLRTAYNSTDRPTKTLARNFTNAREALARLEREADQHRQTLRAVETRLEGAGMATKDLARHEDRLRQEIAGANREIDEQKTKLSELAARQRRVDGIRASAGRTQAFAGSAAGAGAGAIGAGLAVAAPLNESAAAARELQSDMTTIAQRSDMSAKATKQMERQIRAAAIHANQYRTDVVASMDVLTAAGQTEAQALAAMPSIGRAATAYREDPRDLARASAAAQQNLKIDPAENARALDIMAQAGKRGSFEIGNMARELPSLSASYAGLGQTGTRALADIAAAAQIAMRGAGSPEEAATNLSNLMQKIASPETERRFKKLGVNLRQQMEAAARAGQTPLEAITEISRRAMAGGATMGQLFEDAQVQKALRPLLAATDEYRAIRAEALSAQGVVNRDFERRMQDDAEAIKQARIAMGDMAITAGQMLSPAIRAVSASVGRFMIGVNAWAQRHPGLAKGLVIVAAGLAGLLLAFGGLALAVAAVLAPFALLQFAWAGAIPFLGPIAAGIWGAVTATWAWTAALLANPITWIVLAVVAAIALVAGAAWLIYRNWGAISAWFAGVWNRVKELAGQAFAFIGQAIMNFSPVGLLIRAFQAVWPFLTGLGARFAEMGRNLIAGLIRGVLSKLGELRSTITNAASSAANWFKRRMGIHSPSRVFAEFGGHTMGGLALGIERAKNQPLEALGRIGTAMTGALAIGGASGPALAQGGGPGGAMAAQRGGDSIVIHVHAAPGQDVNALADAVLARLQRIQGARARSSFGDDAE